MKASEGLPVAQDLLTDEWPTMRAAAVRAAAAIDPEAFTFVLSGLEPDRDWHVRAAMADVLGGLAPAVALDRARLMLQDEDKRVLSSVLGALVQLKAPDAGEILMRHLKDSDFVVRAAAAAGLGTLKPQGGAAALRGGVRGCASPIRLTARAARSCRRWSRMGRTRRPRCSRPR